MKKLVFIDACVRQSDYPITSSRTIGWPMGLFAYCIKKSR